MKVRVPVYVISSAFLFVLLAEAVLSAPPNSVTAAQQEQYATAIACAFADHAWADEAIQAKLRQFVKDNPMSAGTPDVFTDYSRALLHIDRSNCPPDFQKAFDGLLDAEKAYVSNPDPHQNLSSYIADIMGGFSAGATSARKDDVRQKAVIDARLKLETVAAKYPMPRDAAEGTDVASLNAFNNFVKAYTAAWKIADAATQKEEKEAEGNNFRPVDSTIEVLRVHLRRTDAPANPLVYEVVYRLPLTTQDASGRTLILVETLHREQFTLQKGIWTGLTGTSMIVASDIKEIRLGEYSEGDTKPVEPIVRAAQGLPPPK